MFTFDNKQKLLIPFLENPSTEFHLRELSRIAKLSPAGTSKILKQLLNENLLIKEKTALTDNYRANVENLEYEALKQAYNLFSIKKSGIADYLYARTSAQAIVLFGSFARGDNHRESDIDISIIDGNTKDVSLKEYEEKLGHKINLLFINLKKAKPEFKNNILNGIVLRGFLKVF
jgi:predicted nucleotidyltransferase